MIRRIGLTAVVVHGLINVAHGIAHSELGVELSVLQTGYVVVVIVIAPIVAAHFKLPRTS